METLTGHSLINYMDWPETLE